MTRAAVASIKKKITSIFNTHASIAPGVVWRILPMSAYQGKLYEASVLAEIVRRLNVSERCTINLLRSPHYRLKAKGGHLNRAFPYFEVYDRSGNLFGELFTDTYFISLSRAAIGVNSGSGDYHELDIVLAKPGVVTIKHNDVLLAVETKNTTIEKHIIREILGFRRELSVLDAPKLTAFTTWPMNMVPADPNSVHLLYTSDNSALVYKPNSNIFGTDIVHHTM